VHPNHIFVDAVRFWSMLAVVALHAFQSFEEFRPGDEVTSYPVLALLKFGTIGFFLISGFLLGERISTVAPIPYLSKRLKNLLVPWGVWFGTYVVFLLARNTVRHEVIPTSAASWLHVLVHDAMTVMFESSFWFVPNLALGMCALLLFRRYLYSVKFGAVLFAVNFMYVANIYGRWFISTHTTALFGFISFLWLGSFAARNFARFSEGMDRIRMGHLAAGCGLAWLASFGEMRFLLALHAPDPTNTLRLTNQIFSVLVVLLLFKIQTRSWPGFVHVRQQTYGIYLIHWFYLRIAIQGLRKLVALTLGAGNPPPAAATFFLCALVFVMTYGASLLTAKWLAGKNSLRWTVGLKPEKAIIVEPLLTM
jgi:peptidoglycan/LPS O-acetylase OafA/YrhL